MSLEECGHESLKLPGKFRIKAEAQLVNIDWAVAVK